MSNPAALTLDDVRAIAELAKLELSDAELKTYTAQLSQILEYFTLLQEVDTSGIVATSAPSRTVLRDDIPQPALSSEEVLRNAPDSDEHQFRVNVVLGGE